MRALVTGSHGFAGTHLRALLGKHGATVMGAGRSERTPAAGESYRAVDLRDVRQVSELVREAAPDVVFHLAAGTGHGGADAAQAAIDTNVLGTRHLMAALSEAPGSVRVVHVGSSAQYGGVPDRFDPVDETAPQMPLGLYGWSKSASEAVAMAHHGRNGVEVIAVRPFNQTGPGEPDHLVVASFARQIAAIEGGEEPVLRVGNLSPVRDFTDIRDTVQGCLALAERGAPGAVYNLCSGVGTRVEDVLALLLDKSEVTIEVRADPAKVRPVELMRQVGSAARAHRDVGWAPTIDLSHSLDAVLAGWRERVQVSTSKGNRP